jgi:hypothetical protein
LPLGRLVGHGDHPHFRDGKRLVGGVLVGRILAAGSNEE